MIKNRLGKFLRLTVSHIRSYPLCVETDLVHTDKTNGREVVIEGSEVSLGIRIKSFVKKLRNNRSLDLE